LQITRAGLYDVIKGCMIITATAVLGLVQVSRVYHYIRGEAIIKLYVIFNILEIVDKLCASVGTDIMDALYRTLRDDKDLDTFGRWLHGEGASLKGNGDWRPLWSPVRLCWQVALAIVYVIFHAGVIFVQIVCLNVALNSRSNSLLTLLVSNNFVELKGSVFKRFEPANLFQISCADAVERFQLSLYLGLIILQEGASATLLSSALFIWLAEMVVDSVKHSFVSKFNRLHVDLYTTFTAIVAHDYVSVRGRIKTSLDPTHACVRRLGLSPLPLCCVLLRVTLTNVHPSWFPRAVTSATGFWALAQMLLCLALIKLALSMVLLAFSGSVINTQRGRLVAAAQRAQLAALHSTSSPTHATQPASGSSKRPETMQPIEPTSASSKHIPPARSVPNARAHLVAGAGGQLGAVASAPAHQSFTPAVTPATELKPDFAARYLLADARHCDAGCSLDSDRADLGPCAFQLPVSEHRRMSQLASQGMEASSAAGGAPGQLRASEEAAADIISGSRFSVGRQGQGSLEPRLPTAASPALPATPLLRAEQSRLTARMFAEPGTLGRQLSSSLGMDTPGLLSAAMATSSPALMSVDRSHLGAAKRIDAEEGAGAGLQHRGRTHGTREGVHTSSRGDVRLPLRQPALMRMSTPGLEHEELVADTNARPDDGHWAECSSHAPRTRMAALPHRAAGRGEPTLSADARHEGVVANGHFSKPVSAASTGTQHSTTRAVGRAVGRAVSDDDIEALELMQQMLSVERYSSYKGKAIPL
jgi:hypothetical protein